MRSLNMNRIVGLFFLLTLFIGINISYAQDESISRTNTNYQTTADQLTQSLSEKINLTEDQSARISGLLVNYQTDVSGLDAGLSAADKSTKAAEFDQQINDEILSILDQNQVTAFNDYREQWWQEVRTKVSTGASQMQEMQQE